MAKEINQPNSNLEPFRRYNPLAIRLIIILLILAIPLKIISYGFLPSSDALRHAAKTVSDKPWTQILVLNSVYKVDYEAGWEFFLREVFLWSHCSPGGLVQLSVFFLFVLLACSALPWLKRPEAWLVALIAVALASDLWMRFLLGRPLLLTITGLLTILFYWQKHGASPPTWRTALWMAGIIAACIFMHGVWYLWLVPVAAFFLARQFRWGMTLAAAWVVGLIIGASLTGHPFETCYQAVETAWRLFALHGNESTFVSELQPSSGELFGLIIMGGLLALRHLAKLNARPLATDPVFWLACISWLLGFKAARFDEDWAWPALMVLIAGDLDLLLQSRLAADSFKRLGLTCVLALTAFLVFTNDLGNRWTQPLKWAFLEEGNPSLNGWLPGKGGIFYSADMTLFYQTFFKNPDADWRYILGFEPTLMPDEDFNTYCGILWNSGDADSYQPWIKKMTFADRLVLRGNAGSAPNIPQLEWGVWGRSENAIWIGRLPGAATNNLPSSEATK